MATVVKIVSDLVFSGKISAVTDSLNIKTVAIRGIEGLEKLRDIAKPRVVLMDLELKSADPFLLYNEIKKQNLAEDIYTFYSHVNEDLAIRAKEHQMKYYRRSKFFSQLSELLSSSIKEFQT